MVKAKVHITSFPVASP